MTHLAIWEAPAEGQESEWGEQVSDAEYFADPEPASMLSHRRLDVGHPVPSDCAIGTADVPPDSPDDVGS